MGKAARSVKSGGGSGRRKTDRKLQPKDDDFARGCGRAITAGHVFFDQHIVRAGLNYRFY
jgi:hypothetical protein